MKRDDICIIEQSGEVFIRIVEGNYQSTVKLSKKKMLFMAQRLLTAALRKGESQ